MVPNNLDIFNRIHVLLIILTLSVNFTLAHANSQDSLTSARDSLLLTLNETSLMESANDKERVEIYQRVVVVDDRLIRILKDHILMQDDKYTTSVDEFKKSLAAVNKKLDQVNDRRVKLERTVLTLILVLMMLTYYIFKLQRKKTASGD